MIGAHIELEGDKVTELPVIVPDYVLEYEPADWPQSDVAFWHWLLQTNQRKAIASLRRLARKRGTSRKIRAAVSHITTSV